MLRVQNFSSSEKAALAVAERGAGGRRQRRPAEFHPEADDEMRAAARYYEERQLGLGDEFLNEVERSPSPPSAQRRAHRSKRTSAGCSRAAFAMR